MASFSSLPLYAKERVDIAGIVKESCGEAVRVEKRSRLLSKEEVAALQKRAQARLPSRIVRYYTAERNGGVECIGVVLSRKVRTKKAAVLYVVTEPGRIAAIEILAFAEPPEYEPSKSWLRLMENRELTDPLRPGRDIPAVSGATLSARNVTEGARLALALFEVLKEKK
ncbi:hypothetical protein NNO_0625 [Hydrogenimonas sp.]|nr:hypothetical protein NNO_0625 [Hydrogenimonas sp.]